MIKTMLLATTLLSPVGHSDRLDTVIGVFCGESFSEIYVIEGVTGRTIKQWDNVPREEQFNEEFKMWIDEYYGVEHGNDMTFNIQAVKEPGCTSA